MESFDTFQFQDDEIFDKEIDAVSQVDSYTVVENREDDLACDVEVLPSKLVEQAGSVGALEQAGSQGGMDLHGGVDDCTCELVDGERLGHGTHWTTEDAEVHRGNCGEMRRLYGRCSILELALAVRRRI